MLSGFAHGQIKMFNIYLYVFTYTLIEQQKNNKYSANTYHTFPSLQKSENSILLLLVWSTILSSSKENISHELKILCEWIDSEAGKNLYGQMCRDVQESQTVHQLSLITVALMIFRRLAPDTFDSFDQPIAGSYLEDLNNLFHGRAPGNSGKVVEQMIFALKRVLLGFENNYAELITFLETEHDQKPAQLHIYDGLMNLYIKRRSCGLKHDAALMFVAKAVSKSKMSELRLDGDLDRVLHGDCDCITKDECTLLGVETEYVPAILRIPTCTDLCRDSAKQPHSGSSA